MRRSWKCGCASIRIGGAAFSDLVLVKLGIVAAFIPLMIMYTRKKLAAALRSRRHSQGRHTGR